MPVSAQTSSQLQAVKKCILPSLPSLQDFVKMYRLEANKILSQNYLMDMNLTRKIIGKCGTLADKFVLEIGPGPGSITRALLEHPCKRVDVVEIDQRFIPPLEVLKAKELARRLFIHHSDIKKFDIGQTWQNAGLERVHWLDEMLPSAHIIGNLPFNISTNLVIRFMKQISERKGPWSFGRVPLTLTFQYEVARRIIGEIDSDYRSRIGVMIQYLTEPRILFTIPGKCFVPTPQVNVGVVQFIPRQEPLIPVPFPVVEKLVRQVFHLRRKYILKSIQTLYPKEMSLELSHELLRHCRIDPTTTCVRIGIEEFADMCLYYQKQCNEHPGLFLYDYAKPKISLNELKENENATPPKYEFSNESLNSGISLSNLESHFLSQS